jgi:hypothetical protein
VQAGDEMNAAQKAFRHALKAAWKELGKAIDLCPPGYGIKEDCLDPAFTKLDDAYVWFEQNHK